LELNLQEDLEFMVEISHLFLVLFVGRKFEEYFVEVLLSVKDLESIFFIGLIVLLKVGHPLLQQLLLIFANLKTTQQTTPFIVLTTFNLYLGFEHSFS